jgi:hypothetical protein
VPTTPTSPADDVESAAAAAEQPNKLMDLAVMRLLMLAFILSAITADILLLFYGDLQQQQHGNNGALVVIRLTAVLLRLSVELAVLTLLLVHQSTGSQPSAFTNFMDKMVTLFPFMWPRGDRMLQSLIFACLALVVFGRVINVLVPIQYKVSFEHLQ